MPEFFGIIVFLQPINCDILVLIVNSHGLLNFHKKI